MIVPPAAFEDHPPDCPSWEYDNHPQRGQIPNRISDVLKNLVTETTDTLAVAVDTRDSHRQMFLEVIPLGYEYFAGHYRGENFRCLRFYRVRVRSDPRVGVPPETVTYYMEELCDEIRAGISALDANVGFLPRERLRYVIALASRIFVAFLTIHPYANGNGHAARLIVWAVMGRYGHWPHRWTVDPQPPNPPYTQLIMECRNGNPVPLETYLLQSLVA